MKLESNCYCISRVIMQPTFRLHSFLYLNDSTRGRSLLSRGRIHGRNQNASRIQKKFNNLRNVPHHLLWMSGSGTKIYAVPNSNDGHPSVVSTLKEDTNTNHAPSTAVESWFSQWSPPGYLWRGVSVSQKLLLQIRQPQKENY